MSNQKLYRTLHDQLDQALYPAAFKTCERILRNDPQDQLALETRLQVQLALEQYAVVIRSERASRLAKSYALYKSSRPFEARQVLLDGHESDHEEEDRATKIVLAQIDYRLGNYEQGRDAFDELAHSADLDSPEVADLQHNSETCQDHVTFLESVPTLAATSTEHDSSSIEQLESRPLSSILQLGSSYSNSKPRPTPRVQPSRTSNDPNSKSTGQERPPKSRSNRPVESMKHYKPDRVPDEDRWIPKRQRVGMRDQLMQHKEKLRGKKKDKVTALLTQGSDAPETTKNSGVSTTSTPQKGTGGGANQKGGKKKKGKK
ncbi:tetratricopeptide repeat protein [Sporobolomyces koalae]|uniref:tetratricopeptide repeat protein n=1 Tax=Sporobolomyces koalae TaxID=500713 RepID=UPI00317F7C94